MVQPLHICLVQINQAYSNMLFLPYSAALLRGYAEQYAQDPARFVFHPPLFSRQPYDQMLKALIPMDIVGFSIYAWNAQFSLQLAADLKKYNPKVLIVFGGPMVPDRSEAFLQQNQFIDICCHGEGERTFLNILEACDKRDWESIAGTSYLEQGIRFHTHPKAARIHDINQIPSPYLNDTFEELFRLYPQQDWIALWESNRGCPFSCSFCDWGSAVNSKVFAFELSRLEAEIDWFSAHKIPLVWSCDANFGILKRDLDITNKLIANYQAYGFPQNIFLQSTKNATERIYTIQKNLHDAGLKQHITLSLQSTSETALKQVKRENISMQTFRELQYRFQKLGIPTYTDIIIGLPGETYDSFVKGIDDVVKGGQHNMIHFYNLHVLPNSEVGDPAYQKSHGIVFVKTPFFYIYEPVETYPVQEYQWLVVQTHTMTKEDWRQMMGFSWWSELLYFKNKMLQIPLLMLQAWADIPLSQIIRFYMQFSCEALPVLQGIQNLIAQQTSDMLQGKPGFRAGISPVNVWVRVSEYIQMKLAYDKQLGDFYRENLVVLKAFCQQFDLSIPLQLLQDTVAFNSQLYCMQNLGMTFEMQTNYELWAYYQALLLGDSAQIEEGDFHYRGEYGQIVKMGAIS